MLKKQKRHAFGKDIYLLGQDKDGIKYWLEAPSWECGWYWGFGYIESYTQNQYPEKSKNIASHSHVNYELLGDKKAKDGGYCHNIYDAELLHKTTFDMVTGWELSELFQQFYILKEAAALFRTGSAHTETLDYKPAEHKDWTDEINKKIIPAITERIIKILTP